MQFNITHTTEEKLKSLSERLKYLARNNNSSRNYIDQKVKSENLQFNLSLVISHIIINLKFIDRSKDVFLSIIKEYNRIEKTAITFEDFEKVHWIRTVADEIVMPELVRHFVWQVGYYKNEGKPFENPTDKNDLIRCLQIYFKRCFEDSKLTITNVELARILNDHTISKDTTINNLVKKEIIGLDSKSELYYWKGNEYSKHLGNEIASTLWLLVGGEDATILEFRKYYKLISGTQIWIDDLGIYLSYKNIAKICELAISFLNSESDLLKSDTEFSKIWLDASSYQHVDIKTEIPVVEFDYESTFDFIESVNYHKWRFPHTFDYQKTRSFCHSLFRIIVSNDAIQSTKYENILEIYKDISRPFLLWTLYNDTRREFPFVIPYLLTDLKLIPIAFKLMDKIEIDTILLSEQSNNNRKLEEASELKNNLWLEMFDFTLEQLASTPSYDKEKAELLVKIIIDLTKKVFSINSSNRNSIINHNVLKKRYDEVLKKLSNKRITNNKTYPSPPISPRLAIYLLPHITNYIKEKFQSTKSSHTEFLHLNSGLIDLSIEFLRISNLRISEGEFSKEQKGKNKKSILDLISVLQSNLAEFYSVINIDVQTYSPKGIEKRKAKRGVNEFGFEIIDWGYLFLHFEENAVLEKFNDNFFTALNFNISSDKYDKENKEQFEKIKLYLKSIMLGFISINQKKDLFELEGLPVKATINKLGKWIRNFSLLYSTDDIPQDRIDVFNEMFSTLGYDMYYQHLTSLLYRSINYFNKEEQSNFVKAFFIDSTDIGRMLTAINILDSKELQSIISKRIGDVKIEDFIKNSFTTTELKYALIEAVNSTNHWELSKPLVERIQQHFKKVKHNDENTKNFLFEINLLLAFKEKNMEKLNSIPVPKKEHSNSPINKKGESLKKFFIALFKLYNNKKYDEAIQILNSLLSNDVKNVRYAFHLYRAETLKAIESKYQVLLNQAKKDWDNFVENLTNEEKKELSLFSESIDSNNLHYLITSKDATRFDQTINRLSKKHLYDDELISIIYNYYFERDLHELAFDYINKAHKYYTENQLDIPLVITELKEQYPDEDTIRKLKLILGNLSNQREEDIPKILPNNLNGKTNLSEFILNELVQASKIMISKIESIKQITHENRFNDLLLAILKLRLPIWGWSIEDQPRVGTTLIQKQKDGSVKGGKDAGSADFVIQSSGLQIALWEGLILKDTGYTETHILKCHKYLKSLDLYFMIVYVLGENIDFDKECEKYKKHILGVNYPNDFEMDRAIGYVDVTSNFRNVGHLNISKTIHTGNKEIFHLIINLIQ